MSVQRTAGLLSLVLAAVLVIGIGFQWPTLPMLWAAAASPEAASAGRVVAAFSVAQTLTALGFAPVLVIAGTASFLGSLKARKAIQIVTSTSLLISASVLTTYLPLAWNNGLALGVGLRARNEFALAAVVVGLSVLISVLSFADWGRIAPRANASLWSTIRLR